MSTRPRVSSFLVGIIGGVCCAAYVPFLYVYGTRGLAALKAQPREVRNHVIQGLEEFERRNSMWLVIKHYAVHQAEVRPCYPARPRHWAGLCLRR